MNIKEVREKIEEQAFRLKKASTNRIMVANETERMKNVLYNNVSEIIEILKFAESANEKIDRLYIEVENADAELQDKDDEIKALKEAAARPAAKSKSKKVPNVEQGVQ